MYESYELDLDTKGMPKMDQKMSNRVSLKPCSFATVMGGIELCTRCGDDQSIKSVQFECATLDSQLEKLEAGKLFRPTPGPGTTSKGSFSHIKEYTGSACTYGVIGMQRDTIQQQRGFKVTHSIYSFFLLNVKATVEAGCFYPARPIVLRLNSNRATTLL